MHVKMHKQRLKNKITMVKPAPEFAMVTMATHATDRTNSAALAIGHYSC